MSKQGAGTIDFFRDRHVIETDLALDVLSALPAEKIAYTPHDRAPSAEQLFWTVVRGLQTRNDVAATRKADLSFGPALSYADMLSQFEELSAALTEKLASLDQEQWEQPARLLIGENVVVEKTVGEILWLFHFDLIHHRGQLTTYLRPMGGRVPSIYGKSGDA